MGTAYMFLNNYKQKGNDFVSHIVRGDETQIYHTILGQVWYDLYIDLRFDHIIPDSK